MSKTIVWIEDDFDIIEPVIYPLRKSGYRILNIPNSKEAINRIEELRKADLILLDLFFPESNNFKYPGLNLLQILRSDYEIRTPVIVFSVIGSKMELAEQLYALGVDDIIDKPTRPTVLKQRLEEVLKKHSSNQNSIYKTDDLVKSKENLKDQLLEKPKLNLNMESKIHTQINPKTVFVVHGRNSEARKALFSFLRSIGLEPLEWTEALKATGKATPYVGEVLDSAFSIAQAIIILMTPDDEARLIEDYLHDDDEHHEINLTPQARPNVIFEAGMAMGRNPDRTIIIELGKLRPFSDIGGRHVIRLNSSTQSRQSLAQRLQTAGCKVNFDGTDWHTEGDFDSVLKSIKKKSKSDIKPSKPNQKSELTPTIKIQRIFHNGAFDEWYRFGIKVKNNSTKTIKDYRVEVIFPRMFMIDNSIHLIELLEKRTELNRYFRVLCSEHNNFLRFYPDDEKEIFSTDFFLNDKLKQSDDMKQNITIQIFDNDELVFTVKEEMLELIDKYAV